MGEAGSLINQGNIDRLFDLLHENQVSAFVSALGLITFLIGAYCSYTALRSKPEDVKPWFKWLLFGCLGGGILISLGGATLTLLNVSKDRLRSFSSSQMKPESVLARLKVNAEVFWLIRLIPYDPATKPELSIGRLTHLGRSDQLYTFVGDYAELRGYSAFEAVQRVGGSMKDSTRVSAIIYPLGSHRIYPANARGLLQVIKVIDKNREHGPNYRLFNVESLLSRSEIVDLSDTNHLPSWSWEGYAHYYKDYCEATYQFRCGIYSAKTLMGEVSPDWHPLGFALSMPHPPDPCAKAANACEVATWETTTASIKPTAGARVFLTENADITTLDGRILIDFNDPKLQVIPDLGIAQ